MIIAPLIDYSRISISCCPGIAQKMSFHTTWFSSFLWRALMVQW